MHIDWILGSFYTRFKEAINLKAIPFMHDFKISNFQNQFFGHRTLFPVWCHRPRNASLSSGPTFIHRHHCCCGINVIRKEGQTFRAGTLRWLPFTLCYRCHSFQLFPRAINRLQRLRPVQFSSISLG